MYKMIKRTKPCHCRYKQHTPCDMSCFDVYSCRVSFDNDRQWSCYLMISNRFVHVKWRKSDILFNKKREREKWFRPHPHTVRTDGQRGRTERTRRGRTDAQRLAALRWPRFPFWGVLFNWFPTFFLSLWKMHPFDPFFIPFQRACFGRVLPTVLNVTVSNPVFDTVPVLSLCFSVRDLFPNGQFDHAC